MQLRPARIVAGAIAWIAIAGSALFVLHSERQLSERRAALRNFDQRARETADAAADLRAAQQAYVAAGQGVAFWVAKAVTTGDTVREAVRTLRKAAVADGARHALDDAARSLEQFTETDKRALGYINAAQPLMAADVIFTEGSLAAIDVARYIEQARVADHQEADAVESIVHRQEALAAATAAGLTVLVVLLLVPVNVPVSSESEVSADVAPLAAAAFEEDRLEYARTAPVAAPRPRLEAPVASIELAHAAVGAARPPIEIARPAVERTLRAVDAADEMRLTLDDGAIDPVAVPPPAGPEIPTGFLKAAADLATDFGRVRDMTDLHALVGRTAELIDASGMVLWMASPNGNELRPLLTHGYMPHVVARLAPVSRSASNAAAAAFRSGTVQIVESEPGCSGAIVAPILTADGCIGALAAELRTGDASERIHAVAAIASAHLAAVLMAASEEQTARRAAAG